MISYPGNHSVPTIYVTYPNAEYKSIASFTLLGAFIIIIILYIEGGSKWCIKWQD